jgi:phospholipase C
MSAGLDKLKHIVVLMMENRSLITCWDRWRR